MKPFVLSVPDFKSKRVTPGRTDHAEERVILGELDKWMTGASRPRVVLDCSQLEEVGQREILLLLGCLERVIKRNGDARLACVSAKAMHALTYTGVERLFRIYDSIEAAMRSFESHLGFELVGENRYSNLGEAE